MTPIYAAKLGFITKKTDVGVQKIDGLALVIYEMVITSFSVQDKLGKIRFFKKPFCQYTLAQRLVLGMLFLTPSNADLQFAEKKLEWRSFTTAEALPITKKVDLIDKRKFAAVALDENAETFVMYVAVLETMSIHPTQKAQILLLLVDEAPIEVLSEYSDYADVSRLSSR